MPMTRLYAAVAVVTAAASLACGGSSSTAPNGNGTAGGGHALVIDANPDLKFKPTPDTVQAGDTIAFAWSSSTHSVIFDTPGSPANIGSTTVGFTGGDSTRVFPTAGIYNYHCGIHPTMTGVIVVQ
jgi:plastocyanin